MCKELECLPSQCSRPGRTYQKIFFSSPHTYVVYLQAAFSILNSRIFHNSFPKQLNKLPTQKGTYDGVNKIFPTSLVCLHLVSLSSIFKLPPSQIRKSFTIHFPNNLINYILRKVHMIELIRSFQPPLFVFVLSLHPPSHFHNSSSHTITSLTVEP